MNWDAQRFDDKKITEHFLSFLNRRHWRRKHFCNFKLKIRENQVKEIDLNLPFDETREHSYMTSDVFWTSWLLKEVRRQQTESLKLFKSLISDRKKTRQPCDQRLFAITNSTLYPCLQILTRLPRFGSIRLKYNWRDKFSSDILSRLFGKIFKI